MLVNEGMRLDIGRGGLSLGSLEHSHQQSGEVVALEKEQAWDEAEISAEDEEEFEVEKSTRRACGEGVGSEEVERGDDEEGMGRWQVGTLKDLLLLCVYGLDLGAH